MSWSQYFFSFSESVEKNSLVRDSNVLSCIFFGVYGGVSCSVKTKTFRYAALR